MQPEPLTPTQYRVAEQVSRGLSEKEIGVKMFISEKTVHNHTYAIRKKWNARSAVDICRIFILSLDNPKQFFAYLLLLFSELPVKQILYSMMFLTIQFHIMVFDQDMDLRKPTRTNFRMARGRTGRKKNE